MRSSLGDELSARIVPLNSRLECPARRIQVEEERDGTIHLEAFRSRWRLREISIRGSHGDEIGATDQVSRADARKFRLSLRGKLLRHAVEERLSVVELVVPRTK